MCVQGPWLPWLAFAVSLGLGYVLFWPCWVLHTPQINALSVIDNTKKKTRLLPSLSPHAGLDGAPARGPLAPDLRLLRLLGAAAATLP